MTGFFSRVFGGGSKPPVGLVDGRLSVLSRASCNDGYVDGQLSDHKSQRMKFATFFCLMFFRASEVLIQLIEKDRKLLRFFDGTSRDVLVFEAFSFYSHIIVELNRAKIDAANEHWSNPLSAYSRIGTDLGYSLASDLIGQFGQADHRKRRLEPLLHYRSDQTQMVETFCGVLLCAYGRQTIEDPDRPMPLDADMYVHLTIRKIAHVATAVAVIDYGKNIMDMFSESFDLDVYEEES